VAQQQDAVADALDGRGRQAPHAVQARGRVMKVTAYRSSPVSPMKVQPLAVSTRRE
jgi:hypothetical protein